MFGLEIEIDFIGIFLSYNLSQNRCFGVFFHENRFFKIFKTNNSIKEKITLSLIPRFSGLFIIAIGILIITGPTLLWFLDDLGGELG